MKSQKMKFFGNLKTGFSGKIIVLVIFLALAASAYARVGAEVSAQILRYEPTPAEQGNTVDIWIQLTNAGTKAEGVTIKFEPEYPFSIPEGQPREINVGTVAATEDKVVKFTVFVDPNAPNGDQDIKFWFKYQERAQWIQFEAPITLQTQDATLVVDSYMSVPSPVVPGQIADLIMTLRNAGRIATKNIDVSIDLEDEAFSTIGHGEKKRINYLAPGETEQISFKLASDTSTEVKVYGIPVMLDYQDERNKDYSDEAKISIVVNAEPELSLTVDATEFEKKTKPGTVSLKVVNKGVVDLKYVTVKLVRTPDYEILSPSNEEYVGNLDNDDFETVDFIIKPLVENPRLKIALEFKDPYNVDFMQEYGLPLRIITDKDLGKEKSPIVWIVLAIAAAGGIFYWYKKKKKKKRR